MLKLRIAFYFYCLILFAVGFSQSFLHATWIGAQVPYRSSSKLQIHVHRGCSWETLQLRLGENLVEAE
jgi:hypothetical protein